MHGILVNGARVKEDVRTVFVTFMVMALVVLVERMFYQLTGNVDG